MNLPALDAVRRAEGRKTGDVVSDGPGLHGRRGGHGGEESAEHSVELHDWY